MNNMVFDNIQRLNIKKKIIYLVGLRTLNHLQTNYTSIKKYKYL